ncbi:MAG: putative DNA binding domain-containing protein [Chitinophagaceae bacterium]|jgi:predicted HTH transcriptional regulator|nr:putative DNA binding domain-containing protein [Chitinophagaceae bacterium]
MGRVEQILSEIESCIQAGIFKKLEDDKLDIKDNSHDTSDWKEVFKTACAFLNTNGGIILIGIHEDEKNQTFHIKGFNKLTEDKLKSIKKEFKNERNELLDLEQYFPSYQFYEILGKQILALYIEELPEELKYVYYDGFPYERKITGDHKISPNKIKAQSEYKLEIQNAKELQPVINSKLENINVDKLNEYIQLLNKEVLVERIKVDLDSAKSFLERKGFITQSFEPTILGILVCGNNIDDILGSRSQIDCYVDTGIVVAENKKILKDNILKLMEKGINFIIQNIQVGVSADAGGTSVPEYPIRLIRESVNNSLAHRDYGINKFININIIPQKHIELRNPGRFKSQLILQDVNNKIPIRRIIAGNSKPNNPKLAEVLKVFDKWEGKGLGMSTLTNECLANNIDLPYYKFHSADELSLFIRKGKLLDDKMESLFKAYEGYIEKKLKGEKITEEQKIVLSYYYKSEIENKNERYTILLTRDNNHLDAINTLEESGLIYKHEISNDLYSVFITDRELFKIDFNAELRSLFGAHFDVLNKEGRDVLTCIYEYNKYSKQRYPNANIIGNTLWVKAGKANVLNGFETFQRKIRTIIAKMDKQSFIKKVENKKQYEINEKFPKTMKSIYED